MINVPLTIADAAAGLRQGEYTSEELTQAMLDRADIVDPQIGVYLHRSDVTALAAARRADEELAAGIDRGPLHGIPMGVKDIIATKDAPTTAQSLVLDPGWGEGRDAPVVARLRDAGAVIMGKTTTMEFACGLPDPAKPFPVPLNPWNPEYWTGGSSSGTGSGVATGLFLGGLGTDTGGSIRSPASFCGISGMKATFGRVPKSGCTPLGYSTDHIGPMARSARDCAIMLGVIAGHDASDLTCADEPVPDYLAALDGSVQGLRLGISREQFLSHPNQDPEVVDVFDEAIAVLKDAGAEIVDVTVPYLDEIGEASNVTSRVEMYTYQKLDLRSRRSLYGIHTSDALNAGSAVMGFEYVQAQRFRPVARRAVAELFSGIDALLSPTNGAGAPKVLGMTPLDNYSRASYTRYWNYMGYPALAVPMGFNDLGLPLSLQVVTSPWDEATGFRIGDAYQALTDWHLRVPEAVAPVAVGA